MTAIGYEEGGIYINHTLHVVSQNMIRDSHVLKGVYHSFLAWHWERTPHISRRSDDRS